MKRISLLFSIFVSVALVTFASEKRYSGGDISLLPTYENANAVYLDADGNTIQLLPYLHDIGMNAMRVRLFVNPDDFPRPDLDGHAENAVQDLEYIIPLTQDIVNNGFDLMLDFHYSDTWADPSKQYIPEAWKDLSEDELIEKIYDYTKETLVTLMGNGVVPTFIQPGNEISYGMLWAPFGQDGESNKTYINNNGSAAWQRLGKLLSSAIRACREVCPEAQIVIHTERVAQVNVLTNFYNQMKSLNIDYDIIGLSYYPYYHGKISVLNNALNSLENQFSDKQIMIVETGFPYEWEVPGTDQPVDYDYSYAGQDAFAHELVDTLLAHPSVNGLFWWWMEYNAYKTNPALEGWWYNAPLFDSRNGKATPALKTIASYSNENAGIFSIEDSEIQLKDKWYDINGRIIERPTAPGIYIYNGKKICLK